MEKNGVSLPFEFMVINSKGGSVEFARPEPVHQEDFEGGFSASLFPHGLVPDPNRLWIRFPTYNRYLMKELLPPLGASLVLVAAIVFCFWFTIRVIIRQKEFAGRLTDFINNMTHEFKTPISTIALASEAIAQQGSARSISKTSKYNSVIADENKRMKHQVDKILQMATLEEGKGEFNRSQLDAHEVIERAVENFALQIAARGGSMTIELNAAQNWMLADPVHFENVIHNVLENAVKYSPSAPIITVRTNNDNGGLCIEVSDRGIGIATEHADKVFDKYYRVSTGNLHDVKGFGLGLSYVKLVVQAHGGNVSLVSTPGQGTTVSMNFPLV
jgi:two-component system phosphate regulon sensor histidine kinase PhoR